MTIRTPRSTTTRALLSEDHGSCALNTVAHAHEHCAVDAGSLRALGATVGSQLLVRRSSERLALFTVFESLGEGSPEIHVGTAGAARLDGAPGTIATLEADFLGGDDPASARLTETLLGDDDALGLAILAPHGGLIEQWTDVQAALVHRALAADARPARAWIANGFNRNGAHKCWHITSTELCEHSFPGLEALFAGGLGRGPFAHAVALHGHNDSDDIVVGGGLPTDTAHTALKYRLRSILCDALEAVGDERPRVVVRTSGRLAGSDPANIVNRIALAGNGIQIEQPRRVRDDPQRRAAVVRALTRFCTELL